MAYVEDGVPTGRDPVPVGAGADPGRPVHPARRADTATITTTDRIDMVRPLFGRRLCVDRYRGDTATAARVPSPSRSGRAELRE
ncbi:hypothetical protein Pme01_19710 [Planosporangium mesophilum]|uniref:Uncharacterized protein n=1 Tax=Planosporangium mesophilum TaxID=689768 RepID=A0A8J3T9V4_9ACTN|nr:hypothetical protein Pme01_19710 [Planosporangium mesophilum]